MGKRPEKKFVDVTVESIFWDIDNDVPMGNLSPAFVRPAYAYTKAEVGGIKHAVNVQ